MANLIITVIAIALVAIASLMGAYYGGAAFLNGREEAIAQRYINEATQIRAAFQLHHVKTTHEHEDEELLEELQEEGFFSTVPEGWVVEEQEVGSEHVHMIRRSDVPFAVCEVIRLEPGLLSAPDTCAAENNEVSARLL